MKPHRVLLIALVLVPLSLTLPAGEAAAFCEIVEPPSPVPTQVNGTQVEIQLTEGFARIVIIKEFHNPSDVFKEGQVFFPLEKGHELITDLRLKIGNVVYNSSSENRSEALDAFLEAVAQKQEAALVQYDPPRDVYWVAVTIPPRETRTTITTLEMPLAEVDGFYHYTYRLSVDARDSVDYLRVHVRAETSARLEDFRVPSHPALNILRTGSRIAEAYVNSTQAASLRDLEISFRASGPSVSQYEDPDGEEHYVRFSLDASDPLFSDSLRPRPRAFLVLLDASGSMGLRGRWDLAKTAARTLLEDLNPGESFGLATFHGSAVRSFASRLQAWDAIRAEALSRFLASTRPHGSTSLATVLSTAHGWVSEAVDRGQQPVIVLVSDGRPTRNPTGLDLENAYKRLSYDGQTPIFALAVQPTAHEDENLLRNLSHFNLGALVTLHGDVPGAVAEVLRSVRVPILERVSATFVGANDVTFASSNPHSVWRGGEVAAIAKMRAPSLNSVAFQLTWRDNAGHDRLYSSTLAEMDGALDPLVKRQWILTRIHGYLDALRAHEDPSTRDALIALASENRVVTPYTSLLVILPTRQGDESVPASGEAFDGSAGGFALAAPSSRGSFGRLFGSPLESEARRAEALRRDLANPLVAEGEVDRFVALGSPDHADLLGRSQVARYEGTYIRIVEVSDELVGIILRWPEVVRVETGTGIVMAVLSAWGLCRLRALRRRSRTRGTIA